jgi:oligoribonuclease NrnB/cAMP/cGMP phosphodiesterase (DHH superfamily)
MKICLITHIGDPDGAFPAVLAQLVFEKVDIFSCEVKEVDQTLQTVLESNIQYDAIYIVDLNVTEDMAKKINSDNALKEKITIFDHHASNTFLNTYPFIHVVVEQNGRKECGTTLFYQYLKETTTDPVLEKESLKKIIELVRETDTFDFLEEYEEDALNFRNLYEIYGREKYIEHFLQFVKEKEIFIFSETEKTLIEIEEERSKRYILEKLKHVKKAVIEGYKVGIVFAESNRSMLGHEIAKRMQEEVDIAIIIDVDRSISYRADKEEIDASKLALLNGGGGHKHACGSPLPPDLQAKIVEYIFKDVTWVTNERI